MAGLAGLGGAGTPRPDQAWRPGPGTTIAPGGAAGTFRGRQVIVFGQGKGIGVYVYSPIPKAGNLVISITESGTGPYGETITPGITLYDSNGKPRIVEGFSGEPYLQLQNAYGAVIGLLSNRDHALLWYEDTGSATQGALVASIAGKAGTDYNGNAFPLGVEIFKGVFDGTNFVINSAGQFFYSGTPAAGNLIASIAAASGTDAYGNPYIGGLGSPLAGYAPASGTASVLTGSGWQFFAYSTTLGWVSGSSAYDDGFGRLWLYPEGSIPQIIAATAITAVEPGSAPLKPETWHDISLNTAHWTVRGSGYFTPSYRLNALGQVELRGELTGSSVGNGTTIGTLPSGWQPAENIALPLTVVSVSGSLTLASGQSPRVFISPAGVMSIDGFSSSGGLTCSIDGLTIPAA